MVRPINRNDGIGLGDGASDGTAMIFRLPSADNGGIVEVLLSV